MSGLGIGFGSPGNPHILVRYMSIDRPERLRTAALVGTVWNVLLGWGAVYTGLAARALYAPDVLPDPRNQAFVHMATDLFPPFLAGLMLAALVAAIMSTADSQLLVISSSITRDVYEKVIRRGGIRPIRAARHARPPHHGRRHRRGGRPELDLDRGGREGVFSTVFSFVLLAWSGLGASFGPPLLSLLVVEARDASRRAHLLRRRAPPPASSGWRSAGSEESGPSRGRGVGFVVSTLAFVLVSLLTRPPRDADRLLEAMEPRD